jgi:hypothetical protein
MSSPLDSGASTTETWTCAATEYRNLSATKLTCIELQIARYLLVPEVVLGAAMLVLVIWFRVKVVNEQRNRRLNEDVA